MPVYSYMAQILNETLRCCTIGPFAARVEDKDTVIGGHHIPAGVCFHLLLLLLLLLLCFAISTSNVK